MAQKVLRTTDRAALLAARHDGLGASDAPALMEASPWKSRRALYEQKVARDNSEDSDTLSKRLGNYLEAAIIEAFEHEAQVMVRPVDWMYAHDEMPWLRATLDGEAFCPEHQQWVPLEAKAVAVYKRQDWKDAPPEQYWWQCLQQQTVMGAPCSYIVGLIGNDELVWHHVLHDESAAGELVTAAAAMWRRIQELDPPVPDASESTRRALEAKHVASDEPVAQDKTLPPEAEAEALDLVDQYRDVCKRTTELKTQGEEVLNRLRELCVGRLEVRIPGARITWKPYIRHSVDSKALVKAHPELAEVVEKFTKATEVKPFKVEV